MRKVIGSVFVSLDGVMQAPGAPDEDRSGGFEFGGWLFPLGDQAVAETIDRLFTPPFDLLLGRRTYDIFARYWPHATGEHADMGRMFDRAGKYTVTHSQGALPWGNSHRLQDMEALRSLKQSDGPNLIIQGSGTLYPQLLALGLLDRLTLISFPVILGKGKRLFGDGTPPGTMKMVDHKVSPGGNIIATYEPAGEVKVGSFA